MTLGKSVAVEFFFARGCGRCGAARNALRAAAEAVPAATWIEVDVGEQPIRAVDMGVVSTPAIAIDGQLVFRTVPTPSRLRAVVEAMAARR